MRFTIPAALAPSQKTYDISAVLEQLESDLADRSLDKRRVAIALLERQIRLWSRHDPDLVAKLVRTVVYDLCSDLPLWKSALLSLSVCAVTLQHDKELIAELYSQSVYSVISIIRNGDSLRHLFLACECLFNISKVCRPLMVKYIVDIFPAIASLITCSDTSVRNATERLNSLLKDAVIDDRAFRINSILPILEKFLNRKDPYSRLFALGWIRLLHCSNRVSIMPTLPSVLSMLTDRHQDVTVNVKSFIEAIRHQTPPKECLREVTRLAADRGQACIIRQFALRWMPDLIRKIPSSNECTSAISVVLQTLDDSFEEVSTTAANSYHEIFEALKDSLVLIDLDCIVGPRSQSAALEYLLAYIRRGGVITNRQAIQFRMLRILLDASFQEIRWVLEITILIAVSNDTLVSVLRDLIKTINCCRESILEKRRCSVIMNSLSELVGGFVLFDAVSSFPGSELSAMTIHTMLLTILLSDSLLEFRMHLQSSSSSDIFCRLFTAWISNPIALIGLCLFCRVYELAFLITVSLDAQPNFWCIDTFEQIIQLIELVDSPVFFKIRLDILDIQRHPFLFKALASLLALIPPCHCAVVLTERLQSAMLAIQYSDPAQSEGLEATQVDLDRLYNSFYSRHRNAI